MSSIKGIVADFDGTIVGSDLVISDEVARHVSQLTSRGVSFTIATGRPFKGAISKACRSLNLTGPQIVLGGSEIIQASDQKVLWSRLLKMEVGERVAAALLDSAEPFRIECTDAIYFANQEVPQQDNSGLNLLSISELPHRNIAKVLVEPQSQDSLEMIESSLKQMFPDLSIVRNRLRPEIEDINITANGADKRTALGELVSKLGISKSEIAAIGDSASDLPLLQDAGFKVAVKSRSSQLENIADFTVSAPPNGFINFLDEVSHRVN